MFNVSATASNFVTNGSITDDLMIIVTNAPCQPPTVTIPINSTTNTAPITYYRTDTISVGSKAKLNCSDVVTTKLDSPTLILVLN